MSTVALGFLTRPRSLNTVDESIAVAGVDRPQTAPTAVKTRLANGGGERI